MGWLLFWFVLVVSFGGCGFAEFLGGVVFWGCGGLWLGGVLGWVSCVGWCFASYCGFVGLLVLVVVFGPVDSLFVGFGAMVSLAQSIGLAKF
ncbi:hypothetical protein RA264_27670, partial [Pseudomonas syringae pv. tagetis]|uniref:hypothetical protein n=1 Tax=Pseudomonas syringae group genomosp. 7 TaxID=251699 RepID=UPI00376FA119